MMRVVAGVGVGELGDDGPSSARDRRHREHDAVTRATSPVMSYQVW
jgi:hypothetical protein